MAEDKSQASQDSALLTLIEEHLEYFGYTAERHGMGLVATNPANVSFSVMPYQDGVLFLAPYSVKEGVNSSTPGFLEFINKTNTAAVSGRYGWNDKRGTLYAEAWYPNIYQRKNFGVFLNQWLSEVARYFGTDEADKFLS